MKLIVMANGPFAIPMLEALHASNHEVVMVVGRPDRPAGKRLELQSGPIVQKARAWGTVVEQPETVNDPSFIERLRGEHADLLVVADFGQILSVDCLASSARGAINVHASLLPKYRGAAPVAWAIFHEEKETGVSIIRMSPRLDAGAVILQRAVRIGAKETAGELEARLAVLGAEMTLEALEQIESGRDRPVEQDDRLATRAPRLNKEDGRIDWTRTAHAIDCQIRAMQPWPIAYTDWGRSDGSTLRLQVLSGSAEKDSSEPAEPGTVVAVSKQAIRVATGQGGLAIEKLRPAGKREMDAATFLNGYRLSPGESIG